MSDQSPGVSFSADPEIDTLVEHEDQNKEYDEDEYDIDLFFKLAGYFGGWSWEDFEKTPHKVKMIMNKKIDERLENLDEEDQVFSFRYLEVLLAISKAFGGKS